MSKGWSARQFGLSMEVQHSPMAFHYQTPVTGPQSEIRTLEQIRPSLRDPECSGPEQVYAIAMDVAKQHHLPELKQRMLLFGVVTYAAGTLGEEPIRSQGHIHRVSQHSGWSPPELYEIWQGRAIIYMQERVADEPGRCFAVQASPGQHVLVPPGWAHATISADPTTPLTFAAWCDREYGFEYEAVRAYQGLAWYPLLQEGEIVWQHNPRYRPCTLEIKTPRHYREFGLSEEPLYCQFEHSAERVQFISKPARVAELWSGFVP
ncbi:MAG: glucose-6-phosphate isomerase family protein [Enterobacteriaceae bacterium]